MFAKLKKMKNFKTSLSGLIIVLEPILTEVGIDIPDAVGKWFPIVGMLLFAYFSKDKNVTGGTKSQTGEAEKRIVKEKVVSTKAGGYRKPKYD
ncbi:hypothetical protein LCGC14_1245320 [marine sediment metagenome]|uniref:Holin n=1 Tax=marine sediment metagenome TaxID=412755 RepID=A0A0F9L4N9_9ZZZZ